MVGLLLSLHVVRYVSLDSIRSGSSNFATNTNMGKSLKSVPLDGANFVIEAETFFDFMEKIGLDKEASSAVGKKIEIPLDIVMSLLMPDELEKLQKYITSYLAKHEQQ